MFHRASNTSIILLVIAIMSSSSPSAAQASERSAAADPAAVRKAVTLYASFDERVAGDHGGGKLAVGTRFDHEKEKGRFVVEEGFDEKVFRIAQGKGVHGGALEVVDVLPRRGRIFFPANGNIVFDPKGWGGSVSFWLNTNPNTELKSPFCDPVQITHRGAGDGGLWVDFPDVKPRDMRLGAFSAVREGEKPVKESDPHAPLIHVKRIDLEVGRWRHVAMTWENFDTGRKNARAVLYLDGKPRGELKDREIAMRWDLDRTGIYAAVNYIGLLDEFAVFNRPLTIEEIRLLRDKPGVLGK